MIPSMPQILQALQAIEGHFFIAMAAACFVAAYAQTATLYLTFKFFRYSNDLAEFDARRQKELTLALCDLTKSVAANTDIATHVGELIVLLRAQLAGSPIHLNDSRAKELLTDNTRTPIIARLFDDSVFAPFGENTEPPVVTAATTCRCKPPVVTPAVRDYPCIND
jgi:hypothetical protein